MLGDMRIREKAKKMAMKWEGWMAVWKVLTKVQSTESPLAERMED
jgi:hypothetical protein